MSFTCYKWKSSYPFCNKIVK